MTKRRDPLSFPLAVTRIAALLGWDEAARITDRSLRTVRLWSESDAGGLPTLDQAFALDRAYIEAGGQGAPILESYSRQLDVALSVTLRCQIALGLDIGEAARETSEAVASAIRVTQPGTTATHVHHAIAEAEEASTALTRLLARLKSFLPGNGAGAERSGTN